jgi:Tfp pilus assembly protein PilF
MRNDRLLTLAAAAAVAACAGAQAKPGGLREMPMTDVNRCLQSAKQFNANLQGSFDMYQVVAADGSVPATFVHNAQGIDVPQFFGCLTDLSVASRYKGENLDYLRPNPFKCEAGSNSCARVPVSQEIGAPLDEKLAQSTIHFADWASPTDRGWGHYYVHNYGEAVKQFDTALKANGNDVRALRGMAVALADSNGDLNRAKEAAQKAIQLAPDTEATHEAMIHVCLAQKDDKCAYAEFEAARSKPDVETRSFELAMIQDRVKAAAERLQSQQEQQTQQADAAAEQSDPTGCRKLEPNSDAQVLCLIRRCFERGAREYAKQLKPLTGQDYAAGEWKVVSRSGENAQVTVPIRAGAKAKGKAKAVSADAGPQPHDATWKVSIGETITMLPQNIDAANIAKSHDACKK